ncbi:hypothetical protein GH5_01535 [Leishmania sp. Ghana 2012 LV757]|uniref:hypothetical protein n=1 Tax=Leishmania sp. Ghana 2012 LV757 TaxID=2803181 RepID=UPI001B4F58F4|nr:hypothetical protein GH5_01535 [Leishmania sp. Ghana 2012 LV757]
MQPPTRARRHAAPPRWRVSAAVITALLLLLVVASCSVATTVADTPPADIEWRDDVALALPASAAAAKTPRLEASVFRRLWWHSSEGEDVLTRTIFGKLSAFISTGVVSGPLHGALSSPSRHSEAALPKPLEQASPSLVVDTVDVAVQISALQSPQQQLAPATQAGALKSRFIPKLSVVYAMPEMRLLDSPITAVGQASPIASPPSQAMGMKEGYAQVPITASQRVKAVASTLALMLRAVSGIAMGAGAAEGDSRAAVMNSETVRGGLMRPLNNYAQDPLIYVNSTEGHIPITIVGSSTVVVQFNGEAGNIIKAVVQLREHRYDKSVKSDNCYGMYLRVELRNRYRPSGGAYRAKDAAAVAATAQAHKYTDLSTWVGAEKANKLADVDESSRPDYPSQDEERSSWSSFWDAFAPIFDNSAMCKVLQSVSMRVNKAPITEPYYVVIHSSVIPSFHSGSPYADAPWPANDDVDDPRYTCELDLFFEQESATRLERLQLVFSFLIPMIVLFLPLPFTMWRADLVQQYLMDSDFAEWMWMPPLLLRKKMIDALKMGMEWVMSVRSAYQQRVLRNQLLRQEQAHRSTGAVQPAIQQQQQPGAQYFGWAPATSAAPPPEMPNLLSSPAAAAEAGENAQAELLQQPQQHEPRTQCPFREAEASVSVCSSTSNYTRSHRESIASDLDEPHDSAHHHRGQHHTDGGGSGAGAVTPPRSPRSRNALIKEANTCSSSVGGAIRSRRHRRHARESGSASEASTAVSVHVPPLPDAAGHWGEGNQKGRRARQNGHDLLFTTEEIAGAGQGLTTLEQHNHVVGAQQPSVDDALKTLSRRQREEEEAMVSGGNAADGVPASGASGSAHTGITASSDAAATTSGPATVPSPPKTSPVEQEEEDEQFCRICREGSDVAPLIIPCGCTGSVRFVHASCLDRWRIESAKRNLANVNHCEICKEPFRVSIQRSMLLWESWQHILSGVCLFLACFLMIVVATTLTHLIFGEMSCLASYHQVAYSTMFRFEGISLTLFVYCIMMMLVLFANLIVYSWFRSRPDVEEYVEEMHIVPPFYTRRNVILVVLVSFVLLAQAHATGYLLKYLLYKTSHLAWNWETSPLLGGILFSLFSTCTIAFCSWGRHMYMTHIVSRGLGDAPATDVVVEAIGDADRAETVADNSSGTANPVLLSRSITVPATFAPPASATGTLASAASPSTPPLRPAITDGVSSSSPTPAALSGNAAPQSTASQDADYTQHFSIPPDQRVIRAFEYCPPRRKPPRG